MADPYANVGGNPSFDCVAGHHLFFDIHDDEADSVVGAWCPWCGTGVSDPDRITDDGRPVGFVPVFRLRVPDGFTREIGAVGRG